MNEADRVRLAEIDFILERHARLASAYDLDRWLRLMHRLLREAEAERDALVAEREPIRAELLAAYDQIEQLKADRDRAVAEARRLAIEECAGWHDERAAVFRAQEGAEIASETALSDKFAAMYGEDARQYVSGFKEKGEYFKEKARQERYAAEQLRALY